MLMGFTGTRNGMTKEQWTAVVRLVRMHQPTEVHHGCCLGADAEFHWIVRRELPSCRIVGHPGPDTLMQDHSVMADCDVLLPPKNHFARNRDIVEVSADGMIGAPPAEPLPAKGGTAYTVGHSWKRGRYTAVAWPSGDVDERDAR